MGTVAHLLSYLTQMLDIVIFMKYWNNDHFCSLNLLFAPGRVSENFSTGVRILAYLHPTFTHPPFLFQDKLNLRTGRVPPPPLLE